MSLLKKLLLSGTGCILTGASVVGCAATPAYNPDRLGAAPYAKVTGICRDVMGLSPQERLTGGNWLGNSRLDYYTSYYRGCVMSLSDSLKRSADFSAVKEADVNCRARGYRPGTPDLALCVLNTSSAPAASSQEVAAAATPVSSDLQPVGPFYRASPRETVRRQQFACAALGLDPAEPDFNHCVKDLDNTFYSIGHPID